MAGNPLLSWWRQHSLAAIVDPTSVPKGLRPSSGGGEVAGGAQRARAAWRPFSTQRRRIGRMAVFTVTTASDVVDAADGRLSLREAVTAAERTGSADTIQFAR